MTQPGRRLLLCAISIGLLMLALAFVFAPKSCEGGFDRYFWCGVACLAVLGIMPFPLHVGRSLPVRAGIAVGLIVAGAAVWLGGVFTANFRIICTLF